MTLDADVSADQPQPESGRARTRLIVIIAVTLAVLTAATAAVMFTTQATARSEATRDMELSGDVEALELNSHNGEIRIEAVPDAENIDIALTLRWNGAEPEPNLEEDGAVARLEDGCPDNGFMASIFNACEVEVFVTAPPEVDFEVHSDNSAVTTVGLAGDQDVETSNGDLSIEAASGDVKAQSSNGKVEAENLSSTRVELASSNGSIDASFLVQPETVEAVTSNGPVTVTVPQGGTYAVEAETSNGEREVEVNTDLEAESTIVIETSNGEVLVEYGPEPPLDLEE